LGTDVAKVAMFKRSFFSQILTSRDESAKPSG